MFSDNSAWGLFNFRRAIIRHFVEQGCRVSVCAPYHEDYFRKFRHMGCEPHAIDIDCHGVNPLKDATLLMNYLRLMRRLKPDVSFTYTIKPNLYAGIAAQCLHIPYIALVPGAGQAFIRHTPVTTVVRTLYKVAFRHARQVWFLNSDDAELFRRERLVAKQAQNIPKPRVPMHHVHAFRLAFPGDPLVRVAQDILRKTAMSAIERISIKVPTAPKGETPATKSAVNAAADATSPME